MSGLSPPAWLPHKGHQSSAETARRRGLSVSTWVDMCVHMEERERERGGNDRQRGGEVLTGQFLVAGPDGPVWPLIPQACVQVDVYLRADAHTEL